MAEFSAEWLALREPADRAARSAALTSDLVNDLPAGPLGVLDLACGTGSNFRYLNAGLEESRHPRTPERPSLADPVCWLLVDRDGGLLARLPPTPHVTILRRDLSELRVDLFVGRTLVTASALLDLVSERWVRLLARQCRDSGAAALFALTYDGRITCDPEQREDAIVRDLVNRHQRTDKGFGPALGPAATAAAERAFSELGYAVRRAPSDWMLAPDAHALQRQLIDLWAEAAASMEPEKAGLVEGWRRQRLAHLAAGRSTIRVGHQDVAARLVSR